MLSKPAESQKNALPPKKTQLPNLPPPLSDEDDEDVVGKVVKIPCNPIKAVPGQVVPMERLCFEHTEKPLPFNTGTRDSTPWCRHVGAANFIREDSVRRINSDIRMDQDMKDFANFYNAFFLREDVITEGPAAVNYKFMQFIAEKGAELVERNWATDVVGIAQKLFTEGVLTPDNFHKAIMELTGLMAEKKKKAVEEGLRESKKAVEEWRRMKAAAKEGKKKEETAVEEKAEYENIWEGESPEVSDDEE